MPGLTAQPIQPGAAQTIREGIEVTRRYREDTLIQAALNLDRHRGAHCRTPGADTPDVQRHGER